MAKWVAAVDGALALTARVVDQTPQRVLVGELVVAAGKVVSLFEPRNRPCARPKHPALRTPTPQARLTRDLAIRAFEGRFERTRGTPSPRRRRMALSGVRALCVDTRAFPPLETTPNSWYFAVIAELQPLRSSPWLLSTPSAKALASHHPRVAHDCPASPPVPPSRCLTRRHTLEVSAKTGPSQ